MRLVRRLISLLIISTTVSLATVQAQSSTAVKVSTDSQPQSNSLFNRLIHQENYSFQVDNQHFSGLKLTEVIKASPLVLIGEDHGLAQIPLFTKAVAELLRPRLYVAEIDPCLAAVLTDSVQQTGLPVAYQRQHFQGLAFYSMTEEYALHAKQIQLIGIKQIPYSFAGQLFTLMAQKTKNEITKRYLQQQAKTYQMQFEACMRQHSYLRPSESAINSLLTMTSGESTQVRQVASDFAISYSIYEVSIRRTGGYQQRINRMKHNRLKPLTPYLAEEGSLPTMLFTFEANRLARTLSTWSSVFDVGNLVVNLADAQSKKLLHMMAVGKQGTKAGDVDIDNPSKPSAVS